MMISIEFWAVELDFVNLCQDCKKKSYFFRTKFLSELNFVSQKFLYLWLMSLVSFEVTFSTLICALCISSKTLFSHKLTEGEMTRKIKGTFGSMASLPSFAAALAKERQHTAVDNMSTDIMFVVKTLREYWHSDDRHVAQTANEIHATFAPKICPTRRGHSIAVIARRRLSGRLKLCRGRIMTYVT